MRILYHRRIGSKDGQAARIEEIVSAFQALGHKVILVGPATFNERTFGSVLGAIAHKELLRGRHTWVERTLAHLRPIKQRA